MKATDRSTGKKKNAEVYTTNVIFQEMYTCFLLAVYNWKIFLGMNLHLFQQLFLRIQAKAGIPQTKLIWKIHWKLMFRPKILSQMQL